MTEGSSIVLIDKDRTEAKPYQVRAEILSEGSPQQCLWQGLDIAKGAITAGFWEGQPCILSIAAYPHHEIFFVTDGCIRLEGSDGTVEVAPGQSAYVPKGWSGRWHTVTQSRKHYVIFQDIPE